MNPETTVVETRALSALRAHPDRTRVLLIAEGAADIQVAIRAAEMLTSAAARGTEPAATAAAVSHRQASRAQEWHLQTWRPLVLLGSDTPFPFRTRPSVIIVPGMPAGVIACAPMLEARGIASRLATQADFPGCFDGSLTQLANLWLGSLGSEELREVQVAAWGSALTQSALEALAVRYSTPYHALSST